MSNRVPTANPKANYKQYEDDIRAAIDAVLDSGYYILGEQTQRFEEEFAGYVGVRYGIGVGSGTEALHLALRAAGIGAGDEVITASHTAVATVAAIELAGADPVLIDVIPACLTMDPAQIEAVIGPRTKAIIPVHLYGQPADLAPILALAQRHSLVVIEDCAQAHGARYRDRPVGAWGDAGCFSFYPTKNLGALGDGGMVVTDDPTLAERARLLREYGWAERYVSNLPGWNTRLDEVQAATLRVKLNHLDDDNNARVVRSSVYTRELADTPLQLPTCRPEATHVYHLYVVRTGRRDELRGFLRERGIGTGIHYPEPVHRQPAYRGRLRTGPDLSVTEQAAQTILSLPLYPELGKSQQDAVIDAIRRFFDTTGMGRESK